MVKVGKTNHSFHRSLALCRQRQSRYHTEADHILLGPLKPNYYSILELTLLPIMPKRPSKSKELLFVNTILEHKQAYIHTLPWQKKLPCLYNFNLLINIQATEEKVRLNDLTPYQQHLHLLDIELFPLKAKNLGMSSCD